MNQANATNLVHLHEAMNRVKQLDDKLAQRLTQVPDTQSMYEMLFCFLEQLIAERDAERKQLIGLYQALHKEYQREYSTKLQQYKFIIVIPVADRPVQLRHCLNSLHDLSLAYHYGGAGDCGQDYIKVIVADDSRQPQNKQEHQNLVSEFNATGLNIEYFGERQQLECYSHFKQRVELDYAIGKPELSQFNHKGASATRNLVYLKLRQEKLSDKDTLIHFIDSDQLFEIEYRDAEDQVVVFQLNYYYQLNRLFSQCDIDVATGKVVGDPPVSPAVMTSRMLDDLAAFLMFCQSHEADSACCFHTDQSRKDSGAAYHDMAELFGFKAGHDQFDYQCMKRGSHSIADAFRQFAADLNGFFHGAHPTRRSWYQYTDILDSASPARTVYTGNYIIRPSMLNYYIPFADLKLRMAGPTLGRLLKRIKSNRFVTVNLPMLHTRTVSSSQASEYRPGVNQLDKNINIADEFIRQYFGDVMLFTVKELCKHGYPDDAGSEFVGKTLQQVDVNMCRRYMKMINDIADKASRIESLLSSPSWWNKGEGEMTSSVGQIEQFIQNVRLNFSPTSDVVAQLEDMSCRKSYMQIIHRSLLQYLSNHKQWSALV